MVNGIRRFRIVALASAAAHPDIFAATCVVGSTGDIAILNASLGTRVLLPAEVNTPDGVEYGPTIGTDGRRLAFARTVSGRHAAAAPAR